MITTENTTHSSENTTTRRKMLQSVAVTTAATILYASSSARGDESSQFRSLIVRQQEASAASNFAWDKRYDLKEAFLEVEQPSVLVPYSVAGDGGAPHGRGELSVLGRDGIHQKIEEAHADLRRKFGSKWAAVSMPSAVIVAAEHAICESEAKALAALDCAVRDEQARYEAAGIPKAEAECEALDEVLRVATAEVLAFRPRSLEDVVTKVQWMAAEYEGFLIEKDALLSLMPEVL